MAAESCLIAKFVLACVQVIDASFMHAEKIFQARFSRDGILKLTDDSEPRRHGLFECVVEREHGEICANDVNLLIR